MSLPKSTFNTVLSNYPHSASDFGAGGRIINNPAYEHSCALRLSTALEAASPGFLGQFTGNQAVHLEGSPGNYRRITFPFARSAQGLANYLAGAHVGWDYLRLNSRAEALRLTTQGIIFWKVSSGSGSPNHIDLWDPGMRALRNVGGRTMLWAPDAGIVSYAWFWELMRGNQFSPPSIPHALQSG
jgi:hypothetical protein